MNLNIKNFETCELAAKLAALTGENKTQAIHNALVARLEQLKNPKSLIDDILKIGDDCAKNLSQKDKQININDLLYDEFGLPK